jgi:ferredoxin
VSGRLTASTSIRVTTEKNFLTSSTSTLTSAIDCGACEPECPWQAIFEEPAVPEIFKDDIPLNHATVEMHEQFKVALFQKKEHPTPEQIAANKVKWGMDPNG